VVICVAAALRTLPRARRGVLTSFDIGLLGGACMIGGTMGIYTFGFFSPAPLVTIMGVFFFGLQRDRRVAIAMFAGTAAIHVGVMLAETFELIADRGVLPADDVSVRHKLVAVGLVQVVFLLTFLLARATNRAIVDSARRLEESTRAIAQREALLEEARRELERVLEVGGPGRFTEQQLGGWRLGVLCGRGAMGDVYEARHLETGQRGAVKLLTRDSARDPDSVRRFLREARIAGSIDVPNVVRVLEVGSDDAPVPFIAMELLEGRDLAWILRKQRRLPPESLLTMLREVGRGLDAAHAAGIVHRDLKPQNLFRAERDGEVVWKILDFGVSRLVDVDSSLTRGQAIGTPSYMSPEQARGLDVDQLADIFALGTLAYRALTGRPPFSGSEVPQILYRVVYGMPPRPSELVDVPGVVDDVLAIALAKRPADRFATASELVHALELALAGALPDALRDRARRLTAALPWGIGGRGGEPVARAEDLLREVSQDDLRGETMQS
ncbi:MAG: serine/threonine protein kinase, partial [Myxococcales bacterium]|nr:serine/threonine protein kinase [Myxococcales bacterium]